MTVAPLLERLADDDAADDDAPEVDVDVVGADAVDVEAFDFEAVAFEPVAVVPDEAPPLLVSEALLDVPAVELFAVLWATCDAFVRVFPSVVSAVLRVFSFSATDAWSVCTVLTALVHASLPGPVDGNVDALPVSAASLDEPDGASVEEASEAASLAEALQAVVSASRSALAALIAVSTAVWSASTVRCSSVSWDSAFVRAAVLALEEVPDWLEALPVEAPVPDGFDEPVFDEPVFDEPVFDEPVFDEPVFDEPVFDEPVFDEPVFDEPVFDEPAFDEPAFDEVEAEVDAELTVVVWASSSWASCALAAAS